MTLDRHDVDAIAAALAPRIAALLQAQAFPSRGLVKADRVAALLEVHVSWVYEHKEALGAVRLGEGRSALRFGGSARPHLPSRTPRRREWGSAPRKAGPAKTANRDGVELLPLPDSLR